MKTVRRSKRPSPLVSSKIKTRDRAVEGRIVWVRSAIRVVLGDPQPPACVPGHGDRVLNVGLGGENRDVKAVGNLEARGGLNRRHGSHGRFLGVAWRWEIVADLRRRRRCEKGQDREAGNRCSVHFRPWSWSCHKRRVIQRFWISAGVGADLFDRIPVL